jgi:hypothetical protein
MKTIEKKVPFLTTPKVEVESPRVYTFRVKPSELEYWKKEAKKLGVKDFSAFIRGAIHSAIYVSQRSKEPAWQKFVEAVQPLAKKILGLGFYDGGARDLESGGTYYKGIPAEKFIAKMKKKYES